MNKIINTKPKIILLIGQTASGKTSTAIRLAKEINGEIISADSRQVYNGLNIGSDKVSKEDMEGVPHHLIDIANSLTDTYTVNTFTKDAKKAIADIHNRGKVPIITGGTMLYIDALMGNVLIPKVAPNTQLREKLEQQNTESLFKQLKNKDPRRANQMVTEGQDKNKRRLIRALEIVNELGKVPQQSSSNVVKSLLTTYDILWIGLHNDPMIQKEKINKRNTEMLERGLLTEVENLMKQGITQKQFDTFGFEYKYPAMYLSGTPIIKDEPPTLEQVLMKMNSSTWRYAKKQRAWWSGRSEINWLDTKRYYELVTIIKKFLT